MSNDGATGDGSCTLWADYATSTGDASVEGPTTHLHDVARGATITKMLVWTQHLPAGYVFSYRGLCDPGLAS
ncbi:MAG: hypothetical protein ACXVEI_12615 [Actinomycetota bacterium]